MLPISNFWTPFNSHRDKTPEIHHPKTFSRNVQKHLLSDEVISNRIKFDQERNVYYLPISTSLTWKRKRHVYYMPVDFEKLTLDGLVDTGAPTIAIVEQDVNENKLISNGAIKTFEFGHLMWASTFPVIVVTKNRSVTCFFKAKLLPAALWNACDYVLQYNFAIAHVDDSMNTATDFLSITEVNPITNLEMSIRNDIQTKAIEVNIQSSDIVEKDQIYILADDEFAKNKFWEEKQKVENQV